MAKNLLKQYLQRLFLVHYLRPGSNGIFQNEELDFVNYSKETKARLFIIIRLTRQDV